MVSDEELQTFELQDFGEEDTGRGSELRDPDERSLWEKIWFGPKRPEDQSPSFHLRWGAMRRVDELPQRVFHNAWVRYGVLALYVTLWLSLVGSLVVPYLLRAPKLRDSSNDVDLSIMALTCTQPLKQWRGDNNACGLDADLCKLDSDMDVVVRCPAFCDRAWIYSAVTVGDQRVKYRELNIGGGLLPNGATAENSQLISRPYRADSGVCSSAYHSGLISALSGGCVRVASSGGQIEFPSSDGASGPSVAFNSFFPESFSFKNMRQGITNGCYDPRSLVMLLNILFTLPIFYLYESILGYWVLTITGFWTLVLVFDPPVLTDPTNPTTVAQLVSIGFERLLPLCFILYAIWTASVKRTLQEGSPLIKITLWFPMFWLGVMNNVTFDRLPVDRLTLRDLKELAGALLAVGSIVSTISICAVVQAFALWKSGRFTIYFKSALAVILLVTVLSLIPGLSLRIHHYILGLTLVMFCSTRGASAYLFQGILVGLVISGIGTWGFASIVETNLSLLRGEAGAAHVPPVLIFDPSEPEVVSWEVRNVSSVVPKELDGYSLLINDVERYVGNSTTINLSQLIQADDSFGTQLNESIQNSHNRSVTLYLRVAHANTKNPAKERGDYTNAAIIDWPEGTWQEPQPGVS